jgi:HEAT repeat protein
MTNIDHIMAGVFVLRLFIVVLRIYLKRRKQAEEISGITLKAPKISSEKVVSHESGKRPTDIPAKNEPLINEPVAEKKESHKAINESENNNQPEKAFAAGLNDFADSDPLTIIRTFSAPRDKRILAIQEAGSRKMVEAVPALIEALYEPDTGISLAASESLGEIGDPRAIEPLLEVSRRNDAMLMREMPDSATGVLHSADFAEAEIKEPSANPYNFKELVVFKIDQLPQEYFLADGSPIPRKDLVIKGLKDNSQQMRQMAAKAAIGLEHDDVVEPLIEALDNPFEVESVRFMAAEALGGMQSEKSVDSLLRALKDENVAVRYSAAAALSGRNEEKVIEALFEALSDPDSYVRSSIACALGTTRDPRALNTLFQAMNDESEVVRFSVAKAIACFPSAEIIDEIAMRLQNSHKPMTLSLLEILGHIKEEQSVELLRRYLHHDDSEISYKASMALIGQENDALIDDLIQASRRLDDELLQLMKSDVSGELLRSGRSSSRADAKNVVAADKKLEDFRNLPANLEKLRKGLLDASPNIRGSAANTLGDFSAPEAIELLAAARRDENEFVRSSVVSSLGKIGSEEAVNLVIELASDSSEEVRYAVVKALSGKEAFAAAECLKKIAAGDRAKNVKRAARLALEQTGS